MTPASASGALPAELLEHYDPTVVRGYQLDFEPLAGWEPARDWIPSDDQNPTVPWCLSSEDPNFDADCWDNWTSEEKDSWIGNHPELSVLARAAAWDMVRFDTTNSIVLPAWFSETGLEPAMDPILVGVRRKSSRALPNEIDPQKVGLKIGFNDFVSGQKYRGVTKLSLENGGDLPVAQEGLAWQLHQLAAVSGLYGDNYGPALAAWVGTTVNGQYLGVYTSVEQRNKQFLRNRGLWSSSTTWLYKQDDIGAPELDEGPNPDLNGIQPQSPQFEALCFYPFRTLTGALPATCQAPSDGLLDDLLDTNLEMNTLLTQAAINAFLGNHDSELNQGKNFFFLDRVGEKRRYYPWDLDAVFRSQQGNIYSQSQSTNRKGVTAYQQSPFQQLILNHPSYRLQYNAIMTRLLNETLSDSSLNSLFESIKPSLAPALAGDPFAPVESTEAAESSLDDLKAWLVARRDIVRAQVTANLPAPRKTDSTAPSLGNPALSAASVTPGQQVSLTVDATDASEVLKIEYRVGSGLWTDLSPADGAFGGTSETGTATFTAPASDGSYQICTRATDGSANVSTAKCVNLSVSAPKAATSLVYSGLSSVKAGASLTISATLSSLGTGLSGQRLTFVFNKVTYAATTDSNGLASVSVKAPTKVGNYSLAVQFAGATGYQAANLSTVIAVTR